MKSIHCVFTLLVALVAYPCSAAVVDSTWQGGSGNWSDSTHWDYPSGGYPKNTPSDTFQAYIYDTPSDPTVSLDTSLALDYLLNQETLTMIERTLTLATGPGLDNFGVININAYGSTPFSRTSRIYGAVRNDGTINLNRNSGGGTGNLWYNAVDLLGSGTVNVAQDAVLELHQDADLHDNTVNLHGGRLRATSGYSGGQINGYGSLEGLLGGPIDVAGGTMQFAADSTIRDTGSLNVTGTGVLEMVYRGLINEGELTVQAGGRVEMRDARLSTRDAGVTTIQAGGTVNINTYASSSTSSRSSISGAVTNDGTINLNRTSNGGTGDLYHYAADLFGSGTINVAEDAEFRLHQDVDLHDNTVNLNGGRLRAISGYSGGQINGYGSLEGLLGGPINVAGGTMQFAADSTIRDTGSLNVTDTGVLDMTSRVLTNNGRLTVQDMGVVINTGTINNVGVLTNNGTLSNTGAFTNLGTYQGTGTFVGTLNSGTGTIAPGNSAGTMTVQGNFLLSDGGTLAIEIGGFDPDESDLLSITGSASLLPGSTISFSLLDGYDPITDIPNQGDSLAWMFLEADEGLLASLSSFDFGLLRLGFDYRVYQQGSALWFEATNVVPLPGAAILGLLGLGSSGWLIRRRQRSDDQVAPSVRA